MEQVYVGTKLKYAITVSSPGFNIAENDLRVEIRRGGRSIILNKDDLIVDENDQYYVCFDSAELGSGKVEAIITAFVPDDDFIDGIRTEVTKIDLVNLRSA